MTRVALVTSLFPSPAHSYISEWAAALKRAGIFLTVLTEHAPSAREQQEMGWVNDAGVQIHCLNDIQRPVQSLAANAPRMASALGKPARVMRSLGILSGSQKKATFLRKSYEYAPFLAETYDLVHFNAPQIAVRRFELGELLQAPTLVSFRGQDISIHASRYDDLLQQASHLHFISEHLVGLARERGYTDGRHTIIPPMVDTAFYVPASAPGHDRFRLLTAARLTWVKGWEFALQAIALLVQRGWDIEYEIIGDAAFPGGGDQREQVLYTISELRLQDRVKVSGWLTPTQVRESLQQCDIYLLASVSEAFNNSVLQAQACGVPVVCSDAGGLPENIQDGATGLLAKRRNAWDMADKIEHLLSDAALRLQMGRSGRVRAATCFSMQKGVEAFTDLYRSLTAKV